MELTTAEFLVSEAGRAAIAEATRLIDGGVDVLAGLQHLRKSVGADEARNAWKAAELRRHSVGKLGADAGNLILDQEGGEMASGAATSAYHASLLVRSGARTVVDLCAGLGLDSIAFARAGMTVTAFEHDRARALLLRVNIQRAGVSDKVTVICADVTAVDLPNADAAFFDPARRTATRKWVDDDEQMAPPLSFVRRIAECGITNTVAKLSPAVNREVSGAFNGDLQFLSVKGECKEALLLLGGSRDHHGLSAILLPEGESFHSSMAGVLNQHSGPYIWEPKAAVIRAGLTHALSATLNGWQCDGHIDYFFTSAAVTSPFATCYEVVEEIVYSRNALRYALKHSGKVILKQRGFPQSIESVQSNLKLNGSGTATVILTRFNEVSYAFIVKKRDAEEF